MSSDWREDIRGLEALGKPLSEFSVSGYVLLRRLALALLLLVVGAGLDVILVGAAKIHHFHVLIWGLLLALMGVMLAVRSYRNWGLRVITYLEGGILFRGDRVVTFFWDEITRIWRQKSEEHWSKAWQGSLMLIIEKADGETIWLDDSLPGLRNLATLVEEMTLPHLLSTSISSLEEGGPVEFGELIVHPLGLRVKNETLTWEEFNELNCDDGTLTIFRKGKRAKWHTFKVAEIPNYHLASLLILKFKQEKRMSISNTIEIKGGAPPGMEGAPS